MLPGLFLTGLGYASQVIIVYGNITYIVIIVWAFLYLLAAFSFELPWASCKNGWNTGTAYWFANNLLNFPQNM